MGNLQAALDAPTAVNVTVQATRRREVRRSSRPREYLSGEIEKNAPADANGRPFAGNSKGAPGGPQNNLGPIFAIQTVSAYDQRDMERVLAREQFRSALNYLKPAR